MAPRSTKDISKNPLFAALNGKASVSKVKSNLVPKNPSAQSKGRKIMTTGTGDKIVFKFANDSDKKKKTNDGQTSGIAANPLFLALENKRGKENKRNISTSRSTSRSPSYQPLNKNTRQTQVNRIQVIKAGYRDVIAAGEMDQNNNNHKNNNSISRHPHNNNFYIATSKIGVDVAKQQRNKEIKFKDASKPMLVRIRNLVPGVDRNDVNKIMSQFGPIKEVLMKDYLNSALQKSAMAEVFFYDDSAIPLAIAKLDSVTADGRKLRLYADSKSDIIKNAAKYQELVDILGSLQPLTPHG